MVKKIIALVMSVLTFTSVLGAGTFDIVKADSVDSAENVSVVSDVLLANDQSMDVTEQIECLDNMPMGYIEEPVIKENSKVEINDNAVDIGNGVFLDTEMYASARYNHDWDIYSCNYVYNLLSDDEKAVWDGFEKACNEVLNSNADFDRTPYVYTSKMTSQQMLKIGHLFKASNPQYYFTFGFRYSETSENGVVTTGMSLGIYNKFANGAERTKATNNIKNVLSSWMPQINQCSSEYDKVRKIHDLICGKVVYNYDFVNGGMTTEREQVYLTQTPYSVFCMDQTVCAGYSTAFSMLANGANLDSYCITNAGHEWNKVRINDNWYNIDCTWDDGEDNAVYYKYFCRSDLFFVKNNHVPSDEWNGYLATCTLDTESSQNAVGNIPSVTDKVATPTIKLEKAGENYKVSIATSTPGAAIFYTTNGTNPSQAATKSNKYNGNFVVAAGTTIKAIAVCDRYCNSDIVSSTAKVDNTNALNGLSQAKDGNWYFYKDGEVDTSCNDLKQNNMGWWLVEKGKINFGFNGIAQNSVGEWYVAGGKVDFNKNGLVEVKNVTNFYGSSSTVYNGWYNIKGGQINKTPCLVQNSQGWWYVGNDGKIDFSKNTVTNNSAGWWVVQNGKVNFGFNGIAGNQNGDWYCKSGKVQFDANGLYNTPTGWYFVKGGQVRKGKESVEQYGGSWWYVGNDGKIDFSKNTVAQNQNGWWYVKNGKVDFGANTVAQNQNGWWYIKNGKVDFSYNGLAQNPYGWWYIRNGKLDFSYTGYASNSAGRWYVKNGQVDFSVK